MLDMDIPYTKFEDFGIILFEFCCGQTDKQTVWSILPTPTVIVDCGFICSVTLFGVIDTEIKVLNYY